MKIAEVETGLGELLQDNNRRPQNERQQAFDSLIQRLARYLAGFDRKYLLNCATGFNGTTVPASVNQRISRLLRGSTQLEPKYLNTKTVWQNLEYFIKQT